MELHLLWKVIQRRWWLVSIPGLAALAYALAGVVQSPPRGGYSAEIRFAAAPPPSSTTEEEFGYEDSNYFPWKAGEFLIDGLTGWVPSTSFAEEVSDVLEADGLSIAAEAIYGHFAADNERSVMTVYLNWPNAREAEDMAYAAIDVMRVRHVAYFPQLGDEGAVIRPLDEVVIRRQAPSIGARLNPIIRFGLGLALGLALALGVDYIDPTVRDRQEVEASGLAVLAEIPRHKIK